MQIPHTWKVGTDLHPHVHWVPVSNGTAGQKVSWGLEYSFARIGDSFGNTTIIYGNTSVPNDSSLVADKHYLTNLPEIATEDDITYAVSSMLVGRLFRNTAGAGESEDDYGAAVRLFEFDIHIEIDTVGSREEYTK